MKCTKQNQFTNTLTGTALLPPHKNSLQPNLKSCRRTDPRTQLEVGTARAVATQCSLSPNRKSCCRTQNPAAAHTKRFYISGFWPGWAFLKCLSMEFLFENSFWQSLHLTRPFLAGLEVQVSSCSFTPLCLLATNFLQN